MATLTERIDALVFAGLLNQESPGQYAFRHALLHQAVYSSLLVKERKAYHRAIGESVASLYPNSADVNLADLSHHFYEAGVWDKALAYARMAGEQAQAMYAPREAIAHLTRALDAARHLRTAESSSLYRARAHAYEVSGDFEQARADYESSLAEARATGDRRSEWEALIGLGFLWASRDYGQTGVHMKQALALARTMDDRAVLGHTLNRLGNWYFNAEAGDEARQLHQEALSIFRELDDANGIAETTDLLGMTNMILGNWQEGSVFYRQAIALFRSLDDRRGLSSALANHAQRGVTVYNDLIIPSGKESAAILAEAEEAVAISRDIGWRAGEAYALCVLGSLYSSYGELDRGFDLLSTALRLAEQIGHRQWIVLCLLAIGTHYLYLLDLDQARRHLEQALALAREVRSVNFVRQLSSLLIIVLARKGDPSSLKRAKHVLEADDQDDFSPASWGHRALTYARVALTFARGEYGEVLRTVDPLFSHLEDSAPKAVAFHLRLHKGKALMALHRFAESESVLRELLGRLPIESTRPLRWQVNVALGHVYQRQKRHDESEAQFQEARRIIDELAVNVSDAALRANFHRKAYSEIPRAFRSAVQPAQSVPRTTRGRAKSRARG